MEPDLDKAVRIWIANLDCSINSNYLSSLGLNFCIESEGEGDSPSWRLLAQLHLFSA